MPSTEARRSHQGAREGRDVHAATGELLPDALQPLLASQRNAEDDSPATHFDVAFHFVNLRASSLDHTRFSLLRSSFDKRCPDPFSSCFTPENLGPTSRRDLEEAQFLGQSQDVLGLRLAPKASDPRLEGLHLEFAQAIVEDVPEVVDVFGHDIQGAQLVPHLSWHENESKTSIYRAFY